MFNFYHISAETKWGQPIRGRRKEETVLPNQRKRAEAPGEKGEIVGEWSEEREETGQSEQGKEERRDGEKRRTKNRNGSSTRDPRDPVGFPHTSVKISSFFR